MSAGCCEPCPLLSLYGIWSPVLEPHRFPQKSPRQKLSGPPIVLGSLDVSLLRNHGAKDEEGERLVNSHCSAAPAWKRGNVVQVKLLLHQMQSFSVSVFWGCFNVAPRLSYSQVLYCLCIAVRLSSWVGRVD